MINDNPWSIPGDTGLFQDFCVPRERWAIKNFRVGKMMFINKKPDPWVYSLPNSLALSKAATAPLIIPALIFSSSKVFRAASVVPPRLETRWIHSRQEKSFL